MNRLSRLLFVVAWTGVASNLRPAVAASNDDCRRDALAHLRMSPDGLAIYRQVDDPALFEGWIRCDDAQFDLPTAVHESTHVVTAETDAFPLIGGGAVARPHEVSAFFAPTRIADGFPADDYTTIYLRLGKASSSTDFLYLLDELNAYSHDLATAVDLKDLKSSDVAVDHRDGLAALMAFVAVYAETAQAREPGTWNGLQQPRAARAIAALWGQAERVMASSCGIPNYGTSDKTYLERVCTGEVTAALTPILGRAPVCPRACLESTPDVPASSITDGDRSSSLAASIAPSWIQSLIRFKLTSSHDNAGGDALNASR